MTTHTLLLFKTFNFDETKIWGVFEVQINGDKARVKADNAFFGKEYSRWNKMGCCGGVTGGGKPDEKFHHLTVNGNQVFFRIKYS